MLSTLKMTSVDKDVDKLESLCTGRNVKWCSCYVKQYGGPTKIKYIIAMWVSNRTKTEIEEIFTHTFIAALFTRVK